MSNEIAERVKKIVVEYLGVRETKVMDNSSFMDDLADARPWGRWEVLDTGPCFTVTRNLEDTTPFS